MDDATYAEAVEAARATMQLVYRVIGDDPAAWVAWYYRQLEDEGERPCAAVTALIRNASDPALRSAIAARAVELYDGKPVEVSLKRGPKPEGLAFRNFAALAAMWYLSERLGFQPVMRSSASGPHSVSVCDAVAEAMSLSYKTAESIWTRRVAFLRLHPLHTMALWAALPSATLLGVRPHGN